MSIFNISIGVKKIRSVQVEKLHSQAWRCTLEADKWNSLSSRLGCSSKQVPGQARWPYFRKKKFILKKIIK